MYVNVVGMRIFRDISAGRFLFYRQIVRFYAKEGFTVIVKMARETLFRYRERRWGLKDSVVLIGTFVSWDFTGLST